MTKKGPDTIRIISQNINAMPEDSRQVKSKQIVYQVCNGLEADAWMLQELGLCWPKVHESSQWAERVRSQNVRLNSNLQYNKTEMDRSESKQAMGFSNHLSIQIKSLLRS